MKVSIKSGIAVVVITGMMGLSGVMLTPTVGQVISQVSPQDKLAEAERLNQQVIQLYQQGKYNEAILLAEQALAIRKQQLGDNHPSTATSLNNLAGLYESQGRYSEAEPLYKQVLSYQETTIRRQPSRYRHQSQQFGITLQVSRKIQRSRTSLQTGP
jgi:tetratricopeptide (TPR) repeat protein